MSWKKSFCIEVIRYYLSFMDYSSTSPSLGVSQFSHSVVSDSLRPHESQKARPPCPSPIPGDHPNSCPLSRWWHPAISSSVAPFSSCLQSLPASESFPMNQLFSWGELSHWKKLWCWKGLGEEGEGDDRGWDGWMASPTQWTWVWVYSSSWWWTGRPGVLQFMGSQRVGHDWVTELNGTELNNPFKVNTILRHKNSLTFIT